MPRTPPSGEPLVSDTFYALIRTMKMQMQDAGQKTRLTFPQQLLLPLIPSRGRVGATALARDAGYSLPALGSALDFLERRGDVLRSRSPEDRRRVWISLTPQGRKAVLQFTKESHALHTKINSLFSSSDGRTIARGLTRLASELGATQASLAYRCPICHPSKRH